VSLSEIGMGLYSVPDMVGY